MEAGEFRAELVFLGFEFGGVRGGGLFSLLPRRDVNQQPVRPVERGRGDIGGGTCRRTARSAFSVG